MYKARNKENIKIKCNLIDFTLFLFLSFFLILTTFSYSKYHSRESLIDVADSLSNIFELILGYWNEWQSNENVLNVTKQSQKNSFYFHPYQISEYIEMKNKLIFRFGLYNNNILFRPTISALVLRKKKKTHTHTAYGIQVKTIQKTSSNERHDNG